MPAFQFIPPSLPVLRAAPPSGPGWVHEIKFDGYRVQIHRAGREAAIFSRNGHATPRRFHSLLPNVLALRSRAFVIDAELVACAPDGMPDFRALHGGARDGLCLWCFDLWSLGATDLRAQPLIERRKRLARIIDGADDSVRLSELYEDSGKLLAAAEAMGLEGIVSKRADQAYRSGNNTGWVKVKTAVWREANRDRGDLFR